MTKEEAVRIAQGLITDFKCKSETMVEFCNVVIKALKQQPCEDAVSRSEALSVFRPRGITEDVWKECDVYKKLTALPPVTPKEKTEGEALADIKCIKPALTLSENPTNGDMINALFPNAKNIRVDGGYPLNYIIEGEWHRNLKDWWDAPYKAESEG